MKDRDIAEPARTARTARQKLLAKAKSPPAIEGEPDTPQQRHLIDPWQNLQPGERRILDLLTGREWSEFDPGAPSDSPI